MAACRRRRAANGRPTLPPIDFATRAAALSAEGAHPLRNPRDFVKPLAIGAPDPLLEIPVKPSRMIHFFDPSNEKMAAKVPDIAQAGRHPARQPRGRRSRSTTRRPRARGLVRVGKEIDLGDTALWTRVNSLDSPWVPRRHHHARHRDRRQARGDHGPQGRGRLGHPLRRPPARPARGEGRARAPDPGPRDPRDRARRRQPRGDRRRQPAHAGHELRPGRPRGVAPHEDDARRRRPPRLPRDRGPDPTNPDAPRATAQQDPWHYSIARMVDACTSARGSCPSTAPTATSRTSQGCETQFRAAFLLGCVGAWSLHPVQIDIAKKVFSPDPGRGEVREEGDRGDPGRRGRAHDRRQDAGRRHLEAVQGDGQPGRDARRRRTRSWPRRTGSSDRAGSRCRPLMRFFEYESRQILQREGIPVADGGFATDAEEAKAIAAEIGGPVVIKSQVLTGGRMKAGGVKFADTPEEAEAHAARDPRARDQRPHAEGRADRRQGRDQAGVLRGRDLRRRPQAAHVRVLRHGRDRHRGGGRAAPRPHRPRPLLHDPAAHGLQREGRDRVDRHHRLAS